MSRIGGAAIVSEIRLNNSKLRRDAKESQGILRNLVRGVGTSSGPDPLVNAIGRLAPAAAVALVGIKALEYGTNVFINRRSAASARLRGDLEEEIKLEKEWNDTFRNIPVVGGLGAAIREAFTGEQAALEAQQAQNKEEEKSNAAKQKKLDLINKAREGSEELVRTISRENAAEGKSPRVREIMQALAALEDYKREAQKIADEANKGQLTQPQQEAIKALESRIDALRKKHGPAAFSDAVSAAQQAQISILEAEKTGAQKRVDVAKKEAADKKKAMEQGPGGKVDYRKEAQQELNRVESRIEERQRYSNSGTGLGRDLRRRRQLRDITKFGSTTEGETRRQERTILETDLRQRAKETRELRERQAGERARLQDEVRRDPTNSLLKKNTAERLEALRKRQKAERESLTREQTLRGQRAERSSGRVRSAREGVKQREIERRETPVDKPRMGLRDAFKALFGDGTGGGSDLTQPRQGDKGSKAVDDLGKASDKLDKAADKLGKMKSVGVVSR